MSGVILSYRQIDQVKLLCKIGRRKRQFKVICSVTQSFVTLRFNLEG